jgi:hypothetical protein
MRRGSVVGLLVVLLLSEVPLADASPPDPNWLFGWYDADHDDVVLVVSAVATLNGPTPTLRPLPLKADVVDPLPLLRPLIDDFVLVLLRAPPLAG